MNKQDLLRRVDRVIQKAKANHAKLNDSSCEPAKAADLAYDINEQLFELAYVMQDLLRRMD